MEEVPEGCRMAYMESPLALAPPSRSSCDWLFPPSSRSPPGPADTGCFFLLVLPKSGYVSGLVVKSEKKSGIL